MCIYKHTKKRFPINSYWYWGDKRYERKTIIKVTVNKMEGDIYGTYVRGCVVYKQGRIVRNPFNYRLSINLLYPLTKEDQQQWIPCSLEPS